MTEHDEDQRDEYPLPRRQVLGHCAAGEVEDDTLLGALIAIATHEEASEVVELLRRLANRAYGYAGYVADADAMKQRGSLFTQAAYQVQERRRSP